MMVDVTPYEAAGVVSPDQVITPISNVGEVQIGDSELKIGRFRRASRFLLNLPGQISFGIEKAAIAFRTEPLHYSKRAIQTAMVAAEFSPLNETFRYAALGYALANTNGGFVVGGLSLGASTLLVEGAAALSTASLLETGTSNGVLTKANNFIDERFKRNFKMNPVVEAGVAMVGGSAVVLVEKQREDQSRTLQQRRKHGLFTAGWMATLFTIEGAFIGANTTEGDIISVKTLGATLLTVAATAAGTKFALKGHQKEKTKPINEAAKA